MSQQVDLASILQSPLEFRQILIRAEGPAVFASPRLWNVVVRNQRTGKESTQFVLEDPFYEHDYQEVRWYVEEFAMRDPFAQARANKATQSQLRYGKQLISVIRPFIDEVLEIKSELASVHHWGAVHLLVTGNGTESSLHSLLWEIIERVQCCTQSTFFSVTRVAERYSNDFQSMLPGEMLPSSEQHFRVLYVSARPSLKQDISYRAISRYIWELLKGTEISLDFVRPGTWTKFKSILEDRGEGYYDLVHFDMHGTISKRSSPHKALIHFASLGGASKASDPKSAETVAQLLRKCAVRSVVLNACTSATPSASVQGNFAYTLASHGIIHTSAMTFKVKTDAAVIAMRAIYSTMLQDKNNLLKAVRCAREELRIASSRSGRYGVTVVCEDEINFVYYSAHIESNMYTNANDIGLAVVLDLHRKLTSSPSQKLHHLGVEEGSHAPDITRIQDLDILMVEESLDVSSVVFLYGESGTGKTTLARHMSTWWKETLYAGNVPHFQTLEDFQTWLESYKEFEEPGEKGKECQHDCEIASRLPDYESIILIDSPESYDEWPQNLKECKGLYFLYEMITKCLNQVAKTRVIVFTRLAEQRLGGISANVFYHEVSVPSVEEAATVAAFYIAQHSMNNLDQIEAAETEEVIKQHRMNLTFLHTFIPLQAELKHRSFKFIDQLLDDATLCDFKTFRKVIEDPDSKSALKIAHDRIQSWPLQTDLSHRLVLPMCMFQRQFPADPRLWLRKLYERGPIGQKSKEEPYPIESGKINYWSIGDRWENFPEEWNFEESWGKIRDCLLSLGLMCEDRKRGSKKFEAYRLHPLLPYLLRYEACKLRNVFSSRSLDVYWPILRQTFWEYYECRANEFAIAWLGDESARHEILNAVNNDMANIYEAITVSLIQPLFPFRRIRIYDLVSWINFTSIPQLQLKRWSHLLDRTLARFESILSNQEWKTSANGAKIPLEDTRAKILTIAIQLAEHLGAVYEALGDMKSAIANLERAVDLKTSFTANSMVVAPVAATNILYALRVQAAKAIPTSEWSWDVLNLFTELLTSKIGNKPTGSEPASRSQQARASLVIHLSFDRKLIPADHQLHNILKSMFEGDANFISNIYTKHPGLSQLQSLGGRDFIAYPVPANEVGSMETYTSREHAANVARRIQKDFHQRTPSNSRGYSDDAISYAMDPDAIANNNKFVFDVKRLTEVYEIAKQVKDLRNQAFFLRQLMIGALLDGDEEEARGYEETWKDIGGE